MAPGDGVSRPSKGFLDQLGSVVDSDASSSASPDDIPVWWDNVMTAPAGQGLSEHTQGVRKPTNLGADAQVQKVYSYFSDPQKRNDFATDLYKIGAMNDSRGFTQIGYFAGASQQALAMYAAAKPNIPFTQWLAREAAKSDRAVPTSDGPGSGPRGPGGGGPFTNTTVSLTNPDNARQAVDAAMGEWLGRRAKPGEVNKFLSLLNKHEYANPQVDRGVSSAGGTSAVRGGGTNTELVAEDYAKSRGDYAEATFATTAMDLIKKSIMGDQTEGLM